MRTLWKTLVTVVICGVLLSAVPMASAQKPRPMPAQTQPAPMAQQPVQPQVVVVEPVRVFDPFFAYPYAYSPDSIPANFGYVKIKTHNDHPPVMYPPSPPTTTHHRINSPT